MAGLSVRRVPLDDPFEFYRAVRSDAPRSFILESAPGPKRRAEFTFLGFEPEAVLSARGGQLYVDGAPYEGGFLQGLRDHLAPYEKPALVGHKYLGGLVGYMGYDVVPHLQPVPAPRVPHAFPEFEFGLFLDGFAFEHRSGRAYYFTHGDDRGDRWLALAKANGHAESRFDCGSFESADERAGFERSVRVAQEAIRDGDAYQIVLSRQLRAPFEGDPLVAYGCLRAFNPSPYMYHLALDQRQIAGSSPETLVSVRDGTVTTFPIAGTRPLGDSEAERARLARELLADEKERAEHVMLVDLARNDVGRVAEAGSVGVPQYMTVERYSHVQHIVSRVRGRLRAGLDGLDALAALLPAGTVSGAPKISAMRRIAELEPVARGPYAGAVGYFSFNRTMDTALTIRTAFFDKETAYVQAGAGIVADSVPANEYDEIDHKLGALRRAIAEGGTG